MTAHGISHLERARLEAEGARLIDTTCPLVTRAHDAALALAAEGRHVFVVGQPGHVEVRGLTEDLASHEVVSRPEDVRATGHSRLGVLFQTTTPDARVPAMLEAIRSRHPGADIAVRDTICAPTRKRQQALEALVMDCDLVIAVGGAGSNNTQALVRTARERGVSAHRVAAAAELEPAWFHSVASVGLTAGTSTPDEIIESVARRLYELARTERTD